MRQIFFLILLFFAGSWLARKLRRTQEHARSLPEPMIRCAQCGVHAPRGDVITDGGDYFCSAEHAQRHAARASAHDER